MRVHLIKRQTIEDYVRDHAHSRKPFESWLSIVRHANWHKPSDIIRSFNSADLLGNNSDRVVFNIGGNHFRMICKYKFGNKMVHLSIRWIGTHAQYNELCKRNLQYTINQF